MPKRQKWYTPKMAMYQQRKREYPKVYFQSYDCFIIPQNKTNPRRAKRAGDWFLQYVRYVTMLLIMNNIKRNVAYIDGSNLHNGVRNLDWEFDYARFRVWLTDKYSVEQAYIFLGMMQKYKDLYTYLQRYHNVQYMEALGDNKFHCKMRLQKFLQINHLHNIDNLCHHYNM